MQNEYLLFTEQEAMSAKEIAFLFCCKVLKFKKHYTTQKMPVILQIVIKKTQQKEGKDK